MVLHDGRRRPGPRRAQVTEVGHGIPLGGKRGHGKYTYVSAQDLLHMMQFNFYLAPDGYARTGSLRAYGCPEAVAHRLVLGAPPGFEIDHINGDRLDNRRSNLRVVTRSQNHQNRRGPRRGSSRFKGVMWDKRLSMWRAAVQLGRRCVYRAHFRSEVEAALAYDTAALRIFGVYAAPNFLHHPGSAVTCKLRTIS